MHSIQKPPQANESMIPGIDPSEVTMPESTHFDVPTPAEGFAGSTPETSPQSRGSQLRAGLSAAIESAQGTATDIGTKVGEVWAKVPDPLKRIIVESGKGAVYGAIGTNSAQRTKRLEGVLTNPRKELAKVAKDAVAGGVVGARRSAIERGIKPAYFDAGARLGGMAARAAMAKTKRNKKVFV